MREIHPYGIFVPKGARYLLLGSFPGKDSREWFYGSKRNQFWPIIEEVYGTRLKTKAKKTELMSRLKMAVGDIVWSCERKRESNLDVNLGNLVFNIKGIEKVVKKYRIKKIFFSSRWVETKFRRHFKEVAAKYPEIKVSTLPSPSPRYAAMTKLEKVNYYRKWLPKLAGAVG
jgi:hypoxanthine-DNA glycosylase